MNVQTALTCSAKKDQCGKCLYVLRPFAAPTIAESKLVIVGEAPTSYDIDKKALFSGEAGQLLKRLLGEVGFDPDKLTYTSVLKCPPTELTTIDKKARNRCVKLFLEEELAALKPELIILVGATALDTFFPKASITTKAGSFLIAEDGRKFLPVLHPAFCIRNPAMTPKLRQSLMRAYQYFEGSLMQGKDLRVVSNMKELEEARQIIKEGSIISFDIETNQTLDVFDPTMRLWTIGFAHKIDSAFALPLDHPDNVNIPFREACFALTKEIMENPKIYKVAHNVKFDVKVLKHFGIESRGVIADTMVMAHLLDENRHSKGLKELTAEYIGGYVHNWSEDLKELSLYNLEDCCNTLILYERFADELVHLPKLQDLFNTVVMPMALLLSKIELAGVYIDLDHSALLKKELLERRVIAESLIETEYPITKKYDLNSTKQLQSLFTKLKYPVIKRTKTGFSTDKEVLKELALKGHTLPDYILKIRKYNKLLSTYVEKFPTIIKSDGRLHGEFNICGTVSGRLSSSNPNLQNISREESVRKMFAAPKGKILINADFSQAELRVACSIANEQNMIAAYKRGEDIHKLTASKIVGVPLDKVTKQDRQNAKVTNFGFIYGSSAEGFQINTKREYGIAYSLAECTKFRNAFFSAYPGLLSWYERTRHALIQYGYIEYPTGRRRRFPQAKGFSRVKDDDVFNQAVNSPVQGSSSDIVIFSLGRLDKILTRLSIPAQIIMTVHDSIMIEADKGVEQDVISEVKQIAELDIPAKFPWLKVPMKFDFQVGQSWGDMVEL